MRRPSTVGGAENRKTALSVGKGRSTEMAPGMPIMSAKATAPYEAICDIPFTVMVRPYVQCPVTFPTVGIGLIGFRIDVDVTKTVGKSKNSA